MSVSSKLQLGLTYRLFKALARAPAAALPPLPEHPVEVRPTPVKTLFPQIDLTTISLQADPPRIERSISKKIAGLATRRLGRIRPRVDPNAPVYSSAPDSWIHK